MSNHRYLGFSAAEIAEGLTQIGVNDNNKKTVLCSFLYVHLPSKCYPVLASSGKEEKQKG